MDCNYCHKNKALDKEVVNPLTKEVHPTFAVCEYSFELLEKDRAKYKALNSIGNLTLLGSFVGFIFYDWRVGLLCILMGGIFKLIYHVLIGNRSDKRDALEGQFAKENGLFSFHLDHKLPREIRWCKNCAHFRKVRGWEDSIWSSGEMPDENKLPCTIVYETLGVWTDYFQLAEDRRTLYPKDCPKLRMKS